MTAYSCCGLNVRVPLQNRDVEALIPRGKVFGDGALGRWSSRVGMSAVMREDLSAL